MNELKKTVLKNLCMDLLDTDQDATHLLKEHGLWPLTQEEQDFMDAIIFCCPECGYWYKTTTEVNGLCQDCYEEELEAEMREAEEDEEYD